MNLESKVVHLVTILREAAPLLLETRQRMTNLVQGRLSGRVPVAILDVGLRVNDWLASLSLYLGDILEDAGQTDRDAVYPCDVSPSVEPGRSVRRWLSAREHCALGVGLYEIRELMLDVTGRLNGRFAKSSPAGRVLHKPVRMLDRLRCRLDELMFRQHPAEFDAHAYFPSSTWQPWGSGTGACGPRPACAGPWRLIPRDSVPPFPSPPGGATWPQTPVFPYPAPTRGTTRGN